MIEAASMQALAMATALQLGGGKDISHTAVLMSHPHWVASTLSHSDGTPRRTLLTEL